MKTKLKKINDYILDDYGVDIYQTWLKIYGAIKRSIVTRIIFDFLILIMAILTAICWAGSLFALLLSHPAFTLLYLLASILLLIYAYKPDFLKELFDKD